MVRGGAPAKRILAASPAYLAARGSPDRPADLKFHSCLHYGYLPTGNAWSLEGPDKVHNVHVNGAVCSNNAELLMDSVIKGAGIALLPTFIAGAELQEGRLVSVLPDYSPPEVSIHALYPPNRHLTLKIRLLIDFLADRFGDPPYWDLVS